MCYDNHATVYRKQVKEHCVFSPTGFLFSGATCSFIGCRNCGTIQKNLFMKYLHLRRKHVDCGSSLSITDLNHVPVMHYSERR